MRRVVFLFYKGITRHDSLCLSDKEILKTALLCVILNLFITIRAKDWLLLDPILTPISGALQSQGAMSIGILWTYEKESDLESKPENSVDKSCKDGRGGKSHIPPSTLSVPKLPLSHVVVFKLTGTKFERLQNTASGSIIFRQFIFSIKCSPEDQELHVLIVSSDVIPLFPCIAYVPDSLNKRIILYV